MRGKVILFGPLPPPYGGVAIYMQSLAAHLQDVRVWNYAGNERNDQTFRFVAHRKLGTVPALLAEGRGTRIVDATHFHFEYPNLFLLPAWLALKRILRFRWYKNVHDGSLPKRYPQFGMMQRWLFRRALNSIDEFIVVSDELHRWLREDMKVPQPIAVIPGLLPPPNEDTGLSDKTRRLIAPYLARKRRICSIGVFIPSYGFGDVVTAVETLREQTGEDVGVILLDGDFVRDEDYRAQVLAHRDWITVLEQVPNLELREILKRSDVFVRAFADESYGISRIEAIWSGLPVVATSVGETRGMLTYDFGNQEQLVAQLRVALSYGGLKDTSHWAARFCQEAEENLRAIKRVLGVT